MKVIEATATFTRPNDTTSYVSGELIANSTTAGSVSPMAFRIPYGRGFRIWRAQILKSSTTVTAASFRLHLYKDSPTVANGDNAAWSTTVSGYQGAIDIDGTGAAFTDDAKAAGVYVTNSVFAPMFVVADTDMKLYGLIEARGSYAPAAQEVFTVTLLGESYQ